MSPLRSRKAKAGGPAAKPNGHAAAGSGRPSADDLWLFGEGRHQRLWEVLGAHHRADAGGTTFAVWAPSARSVAVVGGWTGWNDLHPLERIDGSGVWWGFVDGVGPGELYKFEVVEVDGTARRRLDP